ncbi:Glutaredoxin-related protein 5, mitochondrial [Smittium culicis]|uniref:Glutaredoxin-related protein 5, mitochondrial n=1 Tax=Smittium culicis TaxID=133412 RepID=A0A1R1X9B3_9FUNG|nr:Glutaredoxin-related protein 5, mitochondrial [Smittium culicis]
MYALRNLSSPFKLSILQVGASLSKKTAFRSISSQARKLIESCGFSRAAIQVLQVNGVENINGVNCLEDPEVREGIKEFSNWPTIPQIYINREFIGGFDILLEMHKSGELEALLIKEKIINPTESK